MSRYRDLLVRDHDEQGPWIVVLDFSVVALAVVLALFADPGPGSGWVAVAALALPLRHRFPVLVLAAAVLADAGDPRLDMASIIVYSFALAGVAHHRRRGPLLWVVLAVAVFLCFDPWTFRDWDLEHLPRIAGSLLSSIAPVAIGFALRASNELARQRELTRRTEQRTALERDLTADRQRLALELHDSLGHELSLITMMAGTLAVADPETGHRAAERIGLLARQALAELRQIVFTLRGQAESSAALGLLSLASVPAMVTRLRQADLKVTLIQTGDLSDLPEPVDRLAFRIVQESLTNALKHAPGAPLRIAVHREPGRLLLDITNDAPRSLPAIPLPDGHVGLTGLAERATRLHGSITWGPTHSGGWTVTAVLPT